VTAPSDHISGRSTAAPVLSVRGLRKRFGAVQALDDVTLEFRAGEIHAILGENGAGKSTLMHVLDGVLRADAGTLAVRGRPLRFASARDARRAGIGMVHQHFTLVDALTVAENLALSLPQPSRWRFDPAAAASAARALAERIGLDLSPPDARVAELPVGARQRLEILKALAAADQVLILDEPTAVLTPQEVQQLFTMLRRLRAEGRTVLFITHRLSEVKDVADRVTIMRRGQVVGTYAVDTISEAEMAERMVGQLAAAAPRSTAAASDGAVALEVSALHATDARGTPALRDVTFAVHAGEVLGIAGVDGNGQRELFEVLVGLRTPTSGRVLAGGQPIQTFTPRAALAHGIAHIPPDRHREGLVLGMSVEENLLLSRALLERFSRRGLIQRQDAREFGRALAQQYAVSYASLDAPVRSLSGGNQQRIVVARELAQQPIVLITSNPTRGLDFAATRAVADALIEVARRGCAVVVISTDLDEVLDLSDRVRVLYRGHLSTALVPPIDAEHLGLLMAGAAA